MIRSSFLKDILACPQCSAQISFPKDDIICNSCGKVGSVKNEVLNFDTYCMTSAESAFYDDEDYKKGVQKEKERYLLHYNNSSLPGRLEKYFKDELLKIIINHERPFFDIGCGSGTGFKHLGYPEEIVGIDVSFDLITSCKKNFPEADCICCDITHPPIKKNSLKTVFSLATLEHIFHLERFVESIESLLSSDGFFYVLIPNEGGFAWSILRNIAHYKYSKILDFNYKKNLAKVHCNTVYTIDNVLNKFFRIETVRYIPWRVGGNNLNLVKLYRLRKRT
jgi:SAM-dependent methyltransferase